MLYGMLGTKELLQRTYKNLEQIVHLECDGHRIQLPSVQGIVVLNIPRFVLIGDETRRTAKYHFFQLRWWHEFLGWYKRQ